jgi:light-regulated signal transduction histidine kinase (bacteriophytochrome)
MVRDRTAALVDEIEERKRAEQQVRAVAAELERSNGELEEFAYIASHDLQEPLRKIQAFGDRLRNRFRNELPEAGREYVDRMHSSAGRMRRLIDDLLNYSRVTTQAHPFRRTSLSKLVNEVVSDLDELMAQKDATVKVGSLPTIDADPTQLRQLFQNLIANAVKFQRPGVPPVVSVDAEEVSESLLGSDLELVPACRITVSDNGIGFDEKYLDRIFQVFQRLHGRNEHEGSGVGLAICRKIVERHGGTITARSRSGEGATFVVTLPLRQPREDHTLDVQRSQETHHDLDGR